MECKESGMNNETHDRKRARVIEQKQFQITSASRPTHGNGAPIAMLPDEILQNCFSYLDSGNYEFIASVCHLFYQNYDGERCTSLKMAMSSLSRIRHSMAVAPYFFKEEMIVFAAKNNQKELLQYILQSEAWRFVRNTQVTLEWLCCPRNSTWGEDACRMAAAQGKLIILQWLHIRECPWNHRTCTEAVMHNHFHILKYCFEHHCLWNKNTFAAALCIQDYYKGLIHYPILPYKAKDDQIMAFLKEKGCPRPDKRDWRWSEGAFSFSTRVPFLLANEE